MPCSPPHSVQPVALRLVILARSPPGTRLDRTRWRIPVGNWRSDDSALM